MKVAPQSPVRVDDSSRGLDGARFLRSGIRRALFGNDGGGGVRVGQDACFEGGGLRDFRGRGGFETRPVVVARQFSHGRMGTGSVAREGGGRLSRNLVGLGAGGVRRSWGWWNGLERAAKDCAAGRGGAALLMRGERVRSDPLTRVEWVAVRWEGARLRDYLKIRVDEFWIEERKGKHVRPEPVEGQFSPVQVVLR